MPLQYFYHDDAQVTSEKPSRKKPMFPVSTALRDFLKQQGREVKRIGRP